MNRVRRQLFHLGLWAFLGTAAGAAPSASAAGGGDSSAASSPPPDKSRYSLLNPTPKEALREFSPNRPSQSTGPFTVDAGHFYLEADFANFQLDLGPQRTDRWSVFPFVLRAGLTDRVELSLSFENYLNERTRESARGHLVSDRTRSGIGNLGLQLRVNLFGNDRGDVALALVPQITVPTSTAGLGNGSVEGGLIIPLALKLPAGFQLGLQAEFDARRDPGDRHYAATFVNAAILSRSILPKVQGYVEFFSTVNAGPGSQFAGQFDTGLVWTPVENLQIDFGCNFGVTRAAPDYQPFAGFAVRF